MLYNSPDEKFIDKAKLIGPAKSYSQSAKGHELRKSIFQISEYLKKWKRNKC
jgi:hypothetical protein